MYRQTILLINPVPHDEGSVTCCTPSSCVLRHAAYIYVMSHTQRELRYLSVDHPPHSPCSCFPIRPCGIATSRTRTLHDLHTKSYSQRVKTDSSVSKVRICQIVESETESGQSEASRQVTETRQLKT